MRSKFLKKISIVNLFLFGLILSVSAQQQKPPVPEGHFKPSDESLKQYQYPEWFRDAKFGIWAHWGPQAVPRQGDWYAKKMYISSGIDRKTRALNGIPDADYKYHL